MKHAAGGRVAVLFVLTESNQERLVEFVLFVSCDTRGNRGVSFPDGDVFNPAFCRPRISGDYAR